MIFFLNLLFILNNSLQFNALLYYESNQLHKSDKSLVIFFYKYFNNRKIKLRLYLEYLTQLYLIKPNLSIFTFFLYKKFL